MLKSFLMFMLGAMSMYASLVFWAAYDNMTLGMRMRRQKHVNSQINQDGGDGDDTFNNITINIPDGKSKR